MSTSEWLKLISIPFFTGAVGWLGPAIDRAAGPARGAVHVAVGAREYDSIRDSVAQEAVGYT